MPDDLRPGGAPVAVSPPAPRPARRIAAAALVLPAKILGPIEPHRATIEATALLAALPPLLSGPRPADRHPVLVVPGISGGAAWCLALRSYLRRLGHDVHQPRPGATKARPRTVVDRLARQVAHLAQASDGEVSLVGWSVGGALVRQAALQSPGPVRQVVTLGAPVSGFWYRDISGTSGQPMPVPTTAIYSKTDPVFDWRSCAQLPARDCEDVVIPSSHMGMATNSFAYHAIADRLAQPAGQWSPYQPPRILPVQAAPSTGGQRR